MLVHVAMHPQSYYCYLHPLPHERSELLGGHEKVVAKKNHFLVLKRVLALPVMTNVEECGKQG